MLITIIKYLGLFIAFVYCSFSIPRQATAGAGQMFHPYYVSTVEIEHNATVQTLEITCKIFTDDFEKVLSRNNKQKKIDIINVRDTAAMDTIVSSYIYKNLQIKVDDNPLSLQYIGFEKEKESVYCYFEVKGVSTFKKMQVTNSLLNDYKKEQVNLIHLTVNGKRQSTKLDHGKTVARFTF